MARQIDNTLARELVDRINPDTGELSVVEVVFKSALTETEKQALSEKRSAGRQNKVKSSSPFCEWGNYATGVEGMAFQLMCDDRLSASDKNVFWSYACLVEIGNIVQMCQKELASKLGMSTGTVSRAVTKLTELGYLAREPSGVRVSSKIVYRGSWKAFEKDRE